MSTPPYAARYDGPLVEPSIQALIKRKISLETCRKWGYGTVASLPVEPAHKGFGDKNLQCATYCDDTGHPVAQKFRTQDKQFFWRGDPSKAGLYGEWLWRGGQRHIIVTEGEIDALTVSELNDNRFPVVSLKHGAGQQSVDDCLQSLDYLESFGRVVLMLDMDDKGREASEAIARKLSPGKVSIAVLPGKDPSELWMAGNGKAIKDAFWEAKPWRPDGWLKGDALWSLISGPVPPSIGHLTSFPKTDECLGGVRRGEITVLIGDIGAGKSTVGRQIAADLLQQDLRLGIMPLEETPKKFGQSLVGLMAGVHPRSAGVDLNDHKAVFDAVADRLVFYDDAGTRRDTDLFDRLRYLAVADRCDLVVVDHLTVIVGGAKEDDDRRFAERFMSELESLVKRTQVSILVVVHLNKAGEGKSNPTLRDIKGSQLIPALAHNAIAYVRDKKDNRYGQFHVIKCRETGDYPAMTDRVIYNKETGRLDVETGFEPVVVTDLGKGGGF